MTSNMNDTPNVILTLATIRECKDQLESVAITDPQELSMYIAEILNRAVSALSLEQQKQLYEDVKAILLRPRRCHHFKRPAQSAVGIPKE
jgi:hypothetical protein